MTVLESNTTVRQGENLAGEPRDTVLLHRTPATPIASGPGHAGTEPVEPDEATAAVAVARITTAQAATEVGCLAHQLHGALGITQEYPLHHVTRRLWAWRDAVAGERAWTDELGRRAADRGETAVWTQLTATSSQGGLSPADSTCRCRPGQTPLGTPGTCPAGPSSRTPPPAAPTPPPAARTTCPDDALHGPWRPVGPSAAIDAQSAASCIRRGAGAKDPKTTPNSARVPARGGAGHRPSQVIPAQGADTHEDCPTLPPLTSGSPGSAVEGSSASRRWRPWASASAPGVSPGRRC
ncbi:acyl-CoA dehydrogenase family protein [Streptomyces sp. NPDC060000]|uniref:acyl-CoA dehydrogenase family protein n=1 Tax=Streptomyces sp. NPDC060000 TaxID=3347031 RepID=UPI003695F6A1